MLSTIGLLQRGTIIPNTVYARTPEFFPKAVFEHHTVYLYNACVQACFLLAMKHTSAQHNIRLYEQSDIMHVEGR